MIDNSVGQRSPEWYKSRLGNITGSRVADLMKGGRKKEEVFGEVAKSYMLQLAAERTMNPAVIEDDDLFREYLDSASVTSKAMRFGTAQEACALDLFERLAKVTVDEVCSCQHDEIEHFAASPDGVIFCDYCPVACVEVKCPKQEAWMRYKNGIHDAASLKDVMPQYYWQTLAEMECTGTELCYFVAYCPWQKQPLHVAEIRKNEDDARLLRERVTLANEYIQNMIDYGTERASIIQTVRDTVQRATADRLERMAE